MSASCLAIEGSQWSRLPERAESGRQRLRVQVLYELIDSPERAIRRSSLVVR